jgi:peptide/nickel transport system substrate-binding protein
MRKKSGFLVLMVLVSALVLAACGDNTPTPAPNSTTSAATSTTAATTTKATTASGAATTASAATTAAATTQVATLPAQATTAAPSDPNLVPLPALPALPPEAKKGGTLTIALAGTLPAALPPAPGVQDVSDNHFGVREMLWGGLSLMEFNYSTLQYQLGTAQDLKVDPTGKIFTFTLRPGLKWSDGSPLTVDDYQYTFDNIIKENKENASAQYAGLTALRQVASYKADSSANTITITMKEAYARDIAFYNMGFWPAPKKVWEGKPFFDPANNPELKKPTVTGGPYMVESYDPNGQGVLVVNPNWYRGRANFDKIILKAIAPNLVYETLKTGQADVALNQMPPAQFNEVKGNSSLKVYDWYPAIVNYRYIVYNTTKPPFNDKALRQAIVYAVDRQTAIKLTENGRAVPQYGFVNENNPFYNPEVNHYDYSIDKAKKVLTDAGYTFQGNTLIGKDGQPVKFTMSHDNADIAGKLLATYMQAQLKQIGIDMAVDGKDGTAYLTGLVTKQYDVGTGITGAALSTDPDSFKLFYTKDGIYNVAGYILPRLDELFVQGSHELDNTKRKQIYNEVQKILTDDVPSAVFYAQLVYLAANKKVGGIVPSKSAAVYSNTSFASWYFTE